MFVEMKELNMADILAGERAHYDSLGKYFTYLMPVYHNLWSLFVNYTRQVFSKALYSAKIQTESL